MRISGPLIAKIDQSVVNKLIPIAKRLAKKDCLIWGENTEAASRLNWVDLPSTSRELLPQLDSLSAWARSNNLNKVILCGMGGASLAAKVIAATYKKDLVVIDSTHPKQILTLIPADLKQCVIIIGSKSGTTIETISHLKHFSDLLAKKGLNPKDHIVIITDPQTALHISSEQQGLRVIQADPDVGGRFGALSAFGLVPAALLDVDISVLLDDAELVSKSFSETNSLAIKIASLLFTGTSQHFNLCDINSKIPGLSDWIEQLVAESTGKNEIGRLPVVIENPDEAIGEMVIGFSKSKFDLVVEGTLGEQFILWEWATALLCFLLEVDPFSQPNVTAAKERTSEILSLMITGKLIMPTPVFQNENYALFSNKKIENISEFLELSAGYIAVMAYLPQDIDNNILGIRSTIAEKTNKPVTFGWGPRFLHSTGQFHKGGQPNGSFIQITTDNDVDIAIPAEAYSFGQLILAQALGDAAAISEKNFPLLRVHIKNSKLGFENLLKDL